VQDIVYSALPRPERAQKENLKLAFPEAIAAKDRRGKPIDPEEAATEEERV
jgi:hypothetical protein